MFIQIIEYQTSNIDEIRKHVEEYREKLGDRATVQGGYMCSDRDTPNRFVTIVRFPSYEEAMKNSNAPETGELAERLAALCDAPPIFRNLDVVEEFTA